MVCPSGGLVVGFVLKERDRLFRLERGMEIADYQRDGLGRVAPRERPRLSVLGYGSIVSPVRRLKRRIWEGET